MVVCVVRSYFVSLLALSPQSEFSLNLFFGRPVRWEGQGEGNFIRFRRAQDHESLGGE